MGSMCWLSSLLRRGKESDREDLAKYKWWRPSACTQVVILGVISFRTPHQGYNCTGWYLAIRWQLVGVVLG